MAHHRSVIRREARRRNRSKKTSMAHASRFRLVVYRSLKHFEAQVVDDLNNNTIISASSRDKNLQAKLKKTKNKTDISVMVGKALAEKAKKEKLGPLVLDRNGYPYHGRVKVFAEAARENGLEF